MESSRPTQPTCTLDTNVILRVILQDNTDQAKAASALINDSESLSVCDVSIIEAEHILSKVIQLDRPAVASLIVSFLKHKNIKSNFMVIAQACEDYVLRPSLSFPDCYLAREAERREELPLYTFDKKLAHQLLQAKELK